MRNLMSVCSLVFLLSSCNSFFCEKTITSAPPDRMVIDRFFDSSNIRRFKAQISYSGNYISGLLLYKKLSDSTFAGSFINEFGIKGFDFTLSKNSVDLEYVFKNLDKWYIRKKLETDLHFIFSRPEMLTSCSIRDTLVYVATHSRSLHYVYYVSNNNEERAFMYRHNKKVAGMKQYYGEQGLKLNMRYVNGSLNYMLNEIEKQDSIN